MTNKCYISLEDLHNYLCDLRDSLSSPATSEIKDRVERCIKLSGGSSSEFFGETWIMLTALERNHLEILVPKERDRLARVKSAIDDEWNRVNEGRGGLNSVTDT